MAADRLTARFSAWLLRPYLDLGPLHAGPLHAAAIDAGWAAFADPASPAFLPQRAMAPAFRTQLAEEAGPPYGVTDPRELPEPARTARWSAVCEALDGWRELSGARQCRLASLLHSLAFYRPLLAVIPERCVVEDADEGAVELAWWRASARYMLGLPHRTARYDDADMSGFEAIARHASDATPTRFNATAMVFVHKAKTGAAPAELLAWSKRLESALARATPALDAFTAALLTSRFYRALGFLPQRQGDRAAVVRTMETAEHLARALTASTGAQELLRRENLHAVMESRTKEALWLGDMDEALRRAQAVTAVDPHDAKAWVEVGEVRFRRKEWREAGHAYALAATLGPPATAVARHMAGVCLRELGDDALAALLFRDALEADPLGISPRAGIAELPDAPELDALRAWSRSTVEW